MIKSKIKIKSFAPMRIQECTLGCHTWSVARLIKLTTDFEIMEIPLVHLNFYSTYPSMNLRELVEHMKSVHKADLEYPIILDEDGELMDGRHRIMKALLEKRKTIKAVRFIKNPKPCRIKENSK